MNFEIEEARNSSLIKVLASFHKNHLTKITLQMSPFAYYYVDFIEIETDHLPIESGPEQTNLEWFVCLQIDQVS